MKIHILWAALAKKLIHFSQRRLSDVIFKNCKCAVFRQCPRCYKVTTSHHILATPFHKAIQVKHENFHIHRRVGLAKIPGLGQFLPSKKAKIQIFWFHGNELWYKNESSKLLSIFNGNPSIFLAFRYLIGATALKRHGKRNYFRFDYAYCIDLISKIK